jgi:hypothetical protein
MKKLAVLSLLVFSSLWAHATACPTGYSNSFIISVPPRSAMSADLTSFPLYYPGLSLFLAGTGSGGYSQSSTGLDIVFCDAGTGGNLLPYELVAGTYSTTTGLGQWWIKATISKTVTTYIYGFVGKSGASDLSAPHTLWSAYLGVWHFGTSSTLTLTDSTGNSTATNHGATAVAGPLNGGAAFVAASSQYIDTGLTITGLTNFTIEAWAYPTATATKMAISNRNSAASKGVFMSVASGSAMGFGYFTGSASTNYFIRYGSNLGTSGPYASLAGTHKAGTNDNLTYYISGASQTGTTGSSGTATDPADSGTTVVFGRDGAGSTPNYFSGELSEVKISAALLSADWISAEYDNLHTASNFLSTCTINPGSGRLVQWAFCQQNPLAAYRLATISIPYLKTTVGNALLAMCSVAATTGTGTLSATDTNVTYTTRSATLTTNSSLFGNFGSEMFTTTGIVGGADAVTCTTSATPGIVSVNSIYVAEFSPLGAYDTGAHTNNSSGSNPTIALTNTKTPDTVFSCVQTDAATLPTWSNLTNANSNPVSNPICGFTATSATGSFTSTTSGGSSGNYVISSISLQNVSGRSPSRHQSQVY